MRESSVSYPSEACVSEKPPQATAPTDALALAGPPAGARLATSTASVLASDFDLLFWVRACPSVFPNGAGARPATCTERKYLLAILTRYPSSQHRPPQLVVAAANVLQRHALLSKASFCLTEWQRDAIHGVSADDFDTAAARIAAAMAGSSGESVKQAIDASPDGVAQLLRAAQRVGGYVSGLPHTKAVLRSVSRAHWDAFGPSSAFVTYNFSELNAASAMALAGFPIEFDAAGEPTNMCQDQMRGVLFA